MKMFTEKSRVKAINAIRKQSKSGTGQDKVATQNNSILEDLCVQLLQEMRQDRDFIRTETAEIRKNSFRIADMTREFTQLKAQ